MPRANSSSFFNYHNRVLIRGEVQNKYWHGYAQTILLDFFAIKDFTHRHNVDKILHANGC